MRKENSSLSRFKPGVKTHVHLLLAASVWSFMGVVLMFRGVTYLKQTPHLYLFAGLACALGFLKSFIILDRAAKKSLHRIEQFTDGTCLGAVYSIKTWAVVGCMIVMGVLLRRSSLPPSFLGLLYGTIGWALFFSSRHGWATWMKSR